MKYYSELTREIYDTPEQLKEAEGKIKKQFDKKVLSETATDKNKPAVDVERKAAAQKVEEAFAKVMELKESHKAQEDEYAKELEAIEEKYYKLHRELEDKENEETKAVKQKINALDKELAEQAAAARKQLTEFCKKYGAYHYSVNTKNADIFPMLQILRGVEHTGNILDNMFGNFWGLF